MKYTFEVKAVVVSKIEVELDSDELEGLNAGEAIDLARERAHEQFVITDPYAKYSEDSTYVS
jgi:hypothetical protein